jgi:hypothetical protein
MTASPMNFSTEPSCDDDRLHPLEVAVEPTTSPKEHGDDLAVHRRIIAPCW